MLHSLIPAFARVTGMTDKEEDVMTTFSDFSENEEMCFVAIRITETSRWNSRKIKDLDLTQDCLIALVLRGNTILNAGDVLVLLKRADHRPLSR